MAKTFFHDRSLTPLRVAAVARLWPSVALTLCRGRRIPLHGAGAARLGELVVPRSGRVDGRRGRGGCSDLAERLVVALRDRADATLRPLWAIQLREAPSERRAACRQLAAVAYEQLPPAAQSADKFVQMSVVADLLGFEIRAREYDVYVRQWTPVQRRRLVQRTLLDEGCFAVLVQTLAPLAAASVDPEDPDRLRLLFKGNALKRCADEPLILRETVLMPLLRRTNRAGELRERGLADSLDLCRGRSIRFVGLVGARPQRPAKAFRCAAARNGRAIGAGGPP